MLPALEEKPLDEESGKFEYALINEGSDNRKGDASGINSIGKDNSCNSFQSTVSSMTNTSLSDKGKQKILNGSGKPQPLKRVSFGSSRGSMVETLIFESPVREEVDGELKKVDCTTTSDDSDVNTETEKVRVKFFQQSKPQEVDLPVNESEFFDEIMSTATVAIGNCHIQRMESTDSGWENPFRPGGDLSREADEIVELIKGGKPITPTSGDVSSDNFPSADIDRKQQITDQFDTKSANGNVSKTEDAKTDSVDVKRATVKPDGSQIEHVTIKKKPRCKCCVIQ